MPAASNTGFKPTVAIDGATGYLGSHLAAYLREQNFPVRCLVHPGARKTDIEFLSSLGTDVQEVSLDTYGPSVKDAFEHAAVAVHLIGSIAPKKGESLDDLHEKQTENFVRAAKDAGVDKLVQVTALGTSESAKSAYHLTKFKGEQAIKASGLKWVILRPSLIVGRQCGNRNSKLVTRYQDMIRTRPRVPVIGGGGNKIQPIFIGDLVRAIAAVIESDAFDGQILELGGPDVMTMREFVEKLIRESGSTKRITPVPTFAASLMAACCETLQEVPLISRDQIKISSEDNICTDNALTKLGVNPTSTDDALRTYSVTKETSTK